MFFSLLNIFKKIAQVQQLTIQGPAVDTLVDTVINMFQRGAPTVIDDTGFNKNDYVNPDIQKLSAYSRGSAIPISIVVPVMRALLKYKKRQIPYYDQMKQDLTVLINQTRGTPVPQQQAQNVVKYFGEDYGYPLFYIPNLARGKTKILNAIKEEKMSRNESVEDTWKAFYATKKHGFDIYQVDPKFLDLAKNILIQMEYDVSQMVVPSVATSPGTQKPVGKVIKATFDKQNDGSINAAFSFPYNKYLVEVMKTWTGRRDYNRDTKVWNIIAIDTQFLNYLIQEASKLGYDTQELLAGIQLLESSSKEKGEQPEIPSQQRQGFKLRVDNVADKTQGKWHLAFSFFRKGTEEGEYLKEIIKFSFPTYGENGQRYVKDITGSGYKQYLVKGTYANYRQLHDVFARYGFDTSNFDAIIMDLASKDIVRRGRLEGDLEGFQKEFVNSRGVPVKTNDTNAFYNALEQDYEGPVEKGGKIIDFKLYDKQKEGIAFLYGRESALLGDSTGSGKTLGLALAADMRMKNDGGKTVIIAPKAVQDQWIEEIKRFTKAGDDEVSNNILHGRKWTVLSYTDFSSPSKRDLHVKAVQNMSRNGEISCMILDEVHSVKNTNSLTTKNIQNVTKFQDEDGTEHKIPHVWGASATIIANRPIDAYNQLKAINHPLGDMKPYLFATEFGAMQKGRYGLKPGTVEEQIKAANKLKEWFVNWGVYVQRTKKDMKPDVTELEITEHDVPIDAHNVSQRALERMETYKDPSLPISAMIAMRAELAAAKAPHTAQRAAEVLKEGKKVGVFTMFKEPARVLQAVLQQALDQIGGSGTVGTIVGGMHQKTKNKVIHDIKDPNSNMRAVVIAITAGGTGLDFPNVTDRVFINDFDWTPKSAEQSEGRFHRIISEKDVNVEYAVASGTPDQDFYDRVMAKREVAKVAQELTQKQMDLIMKGYRRTDKTRQEVEAKLEIVIKEQARLEESEAQFVSRQVQRLKDNMQGKENEGGTTLASKRNWYKKV